MISLSSIVRAFRSTFLSLSLHRSATGRLPPPTYTFSDHGEAILAWSEARNNGDISAPATLVHFDSHADAGLPEYFDGVETLSPLELAQNVNINDFIPPSILAGLIDRVVWVKPSWGWEADYGSNEYYVAEDRARRAFRSDAPFSPEIIPPPSKGEDLTLTNLRRYRMDVVPFNAEALRGIGLSADKPFLIDVDLDVFSTENLGCPILRKQAGLDLAEVERFVLCSCPLEYAIKGAEETCELEKLRGRMVPAEFAGALGDLDEYGFETVINLICGSPVHYSSEEEILEAMDVMFEWVTWLKERKLAPAAVTVSESTNGYLPPQALEGLQHVAGRMAEAFGSDPPKWIDCSICVYILFINDMDDREIDIFFVESPVQDIELTELLASSVIWHQTINPAEQLGMSAYTGNHFLLTTLDGRLFHSRVSKGKRNQEAIVSLLDELEGAFPVTIYLRNDLDVDADLYQLLSAYDRGEYFPAHIKFETRVPSGEEITLPALAGNKFVIETAEKVIVRFVLRIPTGSTELSVNVSHLEMESRLHLTIRNDLDTDIEPFRTENMEEKESAAVARINTSFYGRISPGEEMSYASHPGHALLLRAVEGEESRQFILRVDDFDNGEVILISELEEMVMGDHEFDEEL